MKKYISYIYVILSAVCWGFIGFSNRLLTAAGIELATGYSSAISARCWC